MDELKIHEPAGSPTGGFPDFRGAGGDGPGSSRVFWASAAVGDRLDGRDGGGCQHIYEDYGLAEKLAGQLTDNGAGGQRQ